MKKAIIGIAVFWLVILAALSVILIILYPVNIIIGGFKENFRACVILFLLAAYVTVLYYKSKAAKK
jgi:hypothetical protein